MTIAWSTINHQLLTAMMFTSNSSEADEVFVKDMAYFLSNKLDTPELLPKDYKHTFILRKPQKAVYSLYKMSLNKELTGETALKHVVSCRPLACRYMRIYEEHYIRSFYIVYLLYNLLWEYKQ